MKYLSQARGTMLGRMLGALPILAVAAYAVARLWMLAASLVPNFGG